jgi:uncharacterized protein (UPF0332 family)
LVKYNKESVLMDKIDLVFKRALESLKVAELNLNNEYYLASINRSYYAVFYAANALLLKKGLISKTHSGTIQKFGLEYVINGDFDKYIGKLFKKLEEERTNADYDFSFEVTKNKAENDLKMLNFSLKNLKSFYKKFYYLLSIFSIMEN